MLVNTICRSPASLTCVCVTNSQCLLSVSLSLYLALCFSCHSLLSLATQLDPADGWPDKICIQCVHQVSRCHAFKSKAEKSDEELRQYIKGITVIVEGPMSQVEIQPHQILKNDSHVQTRHITNDISHNHHPAQQTQQITTTTQHHQPQQMIITNGQLHNAQIINAAGQIVATTAPIQTHLTSAQLQTGQICQLVQTGNGTVQMIQQNGQPAQVVQIQRTSDDRCEIIVQPSDIQTDTTTHYYTEDGNYNSPAIRFAANFRINRFFLLLLQMKYSP